MGSRMTRDGVEKVYAAAATWADRALRSDDSLFTPGIAIWSGQWLAELRTRFLDRPDERPADSADFFDKLKAQLEGSPPEVYQLMAEVLYVQLLFLHTDNMGASTKRNRVERVLGWGKKISAIPDDLRDGLAPGIGGNQALLRQRPNCVGFIIEFVEQWKEAPPTVREECLSDPWAFRDLEASVQFRSRLLRDSPKAVDVQRDALLHLIHPDTFERILGSQKEKTAKDPKFAHIVTDATPDVDRRLAKIRGSMEIEHGPDFDFWEFLQGAGSTQDSEAGSMEPSPESPVEGPTNDLSELADELFLTKPGDFLHRIEELLDDKKQVIFQGPPGTGKTFVAQELAEHLAGPEGSVTLVQMHPSYAYEDFVRGFRPTLQQGQAGPRTS